MENFDLPKGWFKEEVIRKSGLSAGKTDIYYHGYDNILGTIYFISKLKDCFEAKIYYSWLLNFYSCIFISVANTC